MFLIFLASVFCAVSAQLTFRNVMVTCDTESPQNDEVSFGTIVTSTRLKPHLPSDQKCFKISVQHASIPILYSESLSEITNAKFVLLENDEIEEIEPGAFRNMKLKEGLSLRSNKIKEIRRGVFNNVQVPVLFLSFNQISYIDYQAFDNMSVLESVHLDNNKLSRIDSFWFSNTPKLAKVNLQHNLITEVSNGGFQNLVKDHAAPRIDLSHNSIRSVDVRAFTGSQKVKFLSLAHNQLYSLDRNWLKRVKIDVFDVSGNNLRCLDHGLAGPPSTNFIDGNPWDCSCLWEMKKKEGKAFGSLVGEEAFRRCNI